jgi:hypothetical protein
MKFLGPVFVQGADPAAGAEWSVTVPAGQVWIPRLVLATLVTSATVANREVRLLIDDGTTVVASIPSGVTHVASSTRDYTWMSTGGYRGAGSVALDVVVGVGTFALGAGWRLRSQIVALDAGDNWAAPRVLAERWG